MTEVAYKITMPNGKEQEAYGPSEDTPLRAAQMIANNLRANGQSIEGAKFQRMKGDK